MFAEATFKITDKDKNVLDEFVLTTEEKDIPAINAFFDKHEDAKINVKLMDFVEHTAGKAFAKGYYELLTKNIVNKIDANEDLYVIN